jgi:hypothetical protein
MLKFILITSIAGASITGLSLSLIVVLASMAPEAKAENLQPDIIAASACVLQGWPHYQQRCQFDLRAGSDETRSVRVIALR